jgi:inner membrane protein
MSDSPLSPQESRGRRCGVRRTGGRVQRRSGGIVPETSRPANSRPGLRPRRGPGRAAPGRARLGADGSPGRPGMRSAVLRSVRWWAGPLLLAAVALVSDAADRRIPFGLWTTGPVDEVAHVSTAALGLLVLACFIAAPRRFYVAALIASAAIDLDHIPLYLGLLGDQAQRPVTHSLSTVAVFIAAATAGRRRRAVLAGVATGLMLHFARDIAEGSPGVRVFWPLQDTSWMVSYWWFLGMIVVFTAARLVLVSAGLPHTRVPVFRTPSRPGLIPRSPDGPAASGDRRPDLKTQVPDLEAADEARSRTSLPSPRWCRHAA